MPPPSPSVAASSIYGCSLPHLRLQARHNQYLFELMAAYSWGFLAGVPTHGLLPLFYPVFLTILLVHRAHRDEQKCLAKYGAHYEKYMRMVPYKIVPFVY